ncbi:hypothetical protein [Brucella gallinifaecis]|uniref:hypothetical protein n=1 Tax=Brucella gallinifaecis TaxID=215590 RepID=UPI00235FDC81|nr:hypothetical protein [Brucella gallinifaecis]
MINLRVINDDSLILKRTIFNKAAIVGRTNNGEHFVAHVLDADEFDFSDSFENIFTKEAYEAEKYRKPKIHTKQAIRELTAWYAAQPSPEFENLPAMLSEISYDDGDLENQNRLIISCVVNDFEQIQYDVNLVTNELLDTYEDHSDEHLQYLMLDGLDMKTLEIEKRILLQIESELTAFLKANPYDLSDFTDERHLIYQGSLSVTRNRYNEIKISGRTFNGDDIYAYINKDGVISLNYDLMQNNYSSKFNYERYEKNEIMEYYDFYTQRALADLNAWYSKQTIVEAAEGINLSDFKYRFFEAGDDVELHISAVVNGFEEISFKIDTDKNIISDEASDNEYKYISMMLDSSLNLNYVITVDMEINKQFNNYIKENPHSLTYK